SNETSSDDKKIDKPNTTENDKTNEEKEKEALKETGSTMRRSINNANTIDSLKKGQFEAQRKANEAEKKGDIEAANRYRSDAKGLGDVAQDIAKDNKNKVKVPLGKITDDKKQSPVIQRPPTPANSGAK
ncbi:MAG: hypothetical protein LBF28_00360, partial [Rickettsiales bacterium]|nr:hypothetical protein [Rickettsiales bacterium]